MFFMASLWHLVAFLRLIVFVMANTEKTIFTAPESIALPHDAAIDNLFLEALHPNRLTVRMHLNASFPTDDKPHGEETWTLLEGLNPGQRYELRLCWLATQPTAFQLQTYTLAEAFESGDLITSLTVHAYARRARLTLPESNVLQANRFKAVTDPTETSLLFLRVQAAADYFSLNKTLMEHVPPVHVDLILDAYLWNVFPQSLVPTAGYIAAIAIFSWFLSGWVYRQFMAYINRNTNQPSIETVKKSK